MIIGQPPPGTRPVRRSRRAALAFYFNKAKTIVPARRPCQFASRLGLELTRAAAELPGSPDGRVHCAARSARRVHTAQCGSWCRKTRRAWASGLRTMCRSGSAASSPLRSARSFWVRAVVCCSRAAAAPGSGASPSQRALALVRDDRAAGLPTGSSPLPTYRVRRRTPAPRRLLRKRPGVARMLPRPAPASMSAPRRKRA